MATSAFPEVKVSIALFKNTENKSITSIIMIKDKNKEVYTSPLTEVLVVRFEDSILVVSGPGSGYNDSGNAGNNMTEDDSFFYSF